MQPTNIPEFAGMQEDFLAKSKFARNRVFPFQNELSNKMIPKFVRDIDILCLPYKAFSS